MHIHGVFPPIATPFAANGDLDGDALQANVRRWNETGLSGYVVAGSNGESAMLDFDEVVVATRLVRAAALPDHLVITGTGQQSTRAAVRLTQAAAEAGADVALVMTPSFFGAQITPVAMIRHYEAVADASPIPVMVYNVPKFTHVNIAPATVAKIAPHPNVIGIKDSAGDIGQIVNLVRLCPPDFDVVLGNAPAFLAGLDAGATGGILALANVAPRECVEIQSLQAAGRAGRGPRPPRATDGHRQRRHWRLWHRRAQSGARSAGVSRGAAAAAAAIRRRECPRGDPRHSGRGRAVVGRQGRVCSGTCIKRGLAIASPLFIVLGGRLA